MNKFFFLLILLLSSVTLMANAQPIEELIIFGDSLSDNGNLYRYLKVIPKSPPYYKGRFSNGQTWAEHVGEHFLEKHNIKYGIYAVGGATVILRRPVEGAFPYYLKEEVKNYLFRSRSTDRSKTIFFFEIGSNDYLDEKKQDIESLTDDVVDTLAANIQLLVDKGAKYFIVADVPDVSTSPYAQRLKPERISRLKELSKLHHIKLPSALQRLMEKNVGINIIYVDLYGIYADVIENLDKYNHRYNMHITNVTESCFAGGYFLKETRLQNSYNSVSLAETNKLGMSTQDGILPCSNPDYYLFWDTLHPTAVMHKMMGSMFILRVNEFIVE